MTVSYKVTDYLGKKSWEGMGPRINYLCTVAIQTNFIDELLPSIHIELNNALEKQLPLAVGISSICVEACPHRILPTPV